MRLCRGSGHRFMEKGDDVFKYYQVDTQEEINHFYGNIKNLPLYDIGVEAESGDVFLTLST